MTRIKSRPRVTPCGWSIHARGRDLIDQLKDMSIGLWGRSFAANQANIATLYRCSNRDAVNLWLRLARSGYVDVHDGVMRLGDSGRRLMNARYPEPQPETQMMVTERMARETANSARQSHRARSADDFAGVVGKKRLAVLAFIAEHPAQCAVEIGRALSPNSPRPANLSSSPIARLMLLGLVSEGRGRNPVTMRPCAVYSVTEAGTARLSGAQVDAYPAAEPRRPIALKYSPVTIRGIVYPNYAAAAERWGVHSDAISKAARSGKLDQVGLGGTATGITIRGITYPSKTAAAAALGVSRRTLSDRFKSAPMMEAAE